MTQNSDDILKKFKEIARPIIEKLKWIVDTFKDTPVAILTHDNPDPDAISSALIIKKYLRSRGVIAEIIADEDSFSRESKVIVNKIGLEIKPLKEFDRNKYKAVILIDASPNQSNVIKNIEPDLIIDHHDDEAPYESTATIITLLMTTLGFELSKELATALYVGLEIDTLQWTADKFTEFDDLAYKILAQLRDTELRKDIVQAGYSATYLKMLENAISKYFYKEESIVISGVGYIDGRQRTNLARIANFLLDMDGVEKVVVIAIIETEIKDAQGNVVHCEKFIVPATRSSTGIENAGDLNRKVFGEKLAGGDPVKASGAIKLDSTMAKLIEQAEEKGDQETLEKYFRDILKLYREKILDKQTG